MSVFLILLWLSHLACVRAAAGLFAEESGIGYAVFRHISLAWFCNTAPFGDLIFYASAKCKRFIYLRYARYASGIYTYPPHLGQENFPLSE